MRPPALTQHYAPHSRTSADEDPLMERNDVIRRRRSRAEKLTVVDKRKFFTFFRYLCAIFFNRLAA
jgi:hypothetical protein